MHPAPARTQPGHPPGRWRLQAVWSSVSCSRSSSRARQAASAPMPTTSTTSTIAARIARPRADLRPNIEGASLSSASTLTSAGCWRGGSAGDLRPSPGVLGVPSRPFAGDCALSGKPASPLASLFETPGRRIGYRDVLLVETNYALIQLTGSLGYARLHWNRESS